MQEINEDDENEQNEELTEVKDKNKSLITFAKLNKLFLIPFLFAILNFLSILFEGLIDKYNVLKNPEYIKSVLYDLPNVIAGLFHFLSYFKANVDKQKKSTNKEEKTNSDINYIYNESLPPIFNTKTIIMLILLLCLMAVIDDLLWVLINPKDNVFEERLFYLFFIPLFSKIILKENIYKHQYFSLLFSLIGTIFLIIPIIFKLTKDDIIPNILNFIKGINYPLFLVITKYMVEKYYISPLKICLIIGIMTIIINLIGYTIYGLITDDFSFFTDCFNFSEIEKNLWTIIFLILNFLFSIASELTLFLSIFYFYPTLIMVTDIISPLFVWIAETIIYKDEKEINISLNSIGYFIALFSSLIYNELIIIIKYRIIIINRKQNLFTLLYFF